MELFFVTFYSANSLMKSSFWKVHLSIEDSNLLYSELIKEFTGISIPGVYWMLHHILPEAIMYVPSYLFAAVRVKNWIFIYKMYLVKHGGRIKNQENIYGK